MLYQKRNNDGVPVAYAMAVDSVICRQKTCETLTGRMWWDAIGRYQRYELPPGEDLTKKDHRPFTPEEYAHLDRLLKNPNSVLRDYAYEKLTLPGSWKEVDGVTGATAQAVKAEVVEGAGYTCYTLWHWANGDVVRQIRKLTAAALDSALACRLLDSGDEDAILFVLECLESRDLTDRQIIATVGKLLPRLSTTQLSLALSYLCRAKSASAAFYKETAKLFWKLPRPKRQVLLDFAHSQMTVPAVFFDPLTEGLPALGDYYTLHRILALVEKHGYRSQQMNTRVASLLTHTNFLIARRAYWFLETRTLNSEAKSAVNAFLKRHGDRL
jgi:hypothetical protein